MLKFRRSVKSEKHESSRQPAPVNLPHKDPSAIEPPKKVIKALFDWHEHQPGGMYLPFSAGDFLHVVARENDDEWYEACNPLKNERGLVPVNFFETLGKTVRDSGDSSKAANAMHDSGYAEGMGRSMGMSQSQQQANGAVAASVPAHRSSKSVSKSAAGVYGVVVYDFHAERPDELDAKEGEAIIVIAQSNPEWFVAKPITRLGGPGLIPVSFIELRDMSTGKAVADTLEAVQRAGIPRVEEWKKMAAEYKNTSIPLGMVSSSQQVQNLQQGMDRLSMGSGGQQQQQQQQNGYGHSRQESSMTYQAQEQQNLFAPERASVPRYLFADDKFHFIVECRLANGAHWDLSRIYEDFYELQINLINAFPEEAGQVPGRQRILPYMPGPVKFVTDNISEGRRANLDEYLRDLLRLAPYITSSSLVCKFFAPRQGDYEVDPNATDLEEHARAVEPQDRYSRSSNNSPQTGGAYQSATQPPAQAMHQRSASQATTNGYGHQRQQQSMASTYSHARAPSEQQHRPLPSSSSAAATSANAATSNTRPQPTDPVPDLTNLPGPVKVKAWFDRDTCVVIRMPPRKQFGFTQLYQKIAERRILEYRNTTNVAVEEEPLEIEYRDEITEEYYRLEGDKDLDVALARNEKLTLAVRKKEKRPASNGGDDGEADKGDGGDEAAG